MLRTRISYVDLGWPMGLMLIAYVAWKNGDGCAASSGSGNREAQRRCIVGRDEALQGIVLKARKTKLNLDAPNQLAATPKIVRIYENSEPKSSPPLSRS